MKYTDLSINLGFQRNMRETSWLKLFPHWWSENDPLTEAIGKEIESIKAKAIFKILNSTIKPSVMIWQNSINNEEYIESVTINNLNPEVVKLPAPLYKTFGTITLTSNTVQTISNLQIALNEKDSLTISDNINEGDIVTINVGSQEVYINKKKVNTIIKGSGLSYFKTSKNNDEYDPNTPLHNEALVISFYCPDHIDDINIDVDIVLKNAVFNNEQNIEVTGLELIPIKKVEFYAYYDFAYHIEANGWRKVYEKEYDVTTNVIYDMITVQFFTKKFYVKVHYKGLDYPYTVGFPCNKNEPLESIYHVNNSLDRWGQLLGMPRRIYKTNIPDEDYPFTFPQYYPFDIEQDFWYYSRLINEYAWNDLAINDVDIVDIDNNPIIRLHSIDPFVQDFVVEAKSIYAKEREGVDYSKYTPTEISQESPEADYKRVTYFDTQNLLKYDNNKAYVTLANKKNFAISAQKYKSNKLLSYFNLENLPENINIDNIQVLVEAESTDNAKTKYSNNETGLIIPAIGENILIPMKQSSDYELEEKEIIYDLTDGIEKVKKMYDDVDKNVLQHATIKPFGGKQGSYISIPFVLKENDTIIDDITDVYVTYNAADTYKAEYHHTDDERYIYVYLPKYITESNYKQQDTTEQTDGQYYKEVSMNIACKSENHSSFVGANIQMILKTTTNTDTDDTEEEIAKELTQNVQLYGPYVDNKIQNQYLTNEWHTSDLRNMLQTDGLYFVNVFENEDETNTPTILIKNITLKISYSPKQSDFKIKTGIIKNNVEKPNIAKLLVEINNIGSKQLKTNVDIVSATNLKLDTSYIDVDLNIGESLTEYINIQPEYPILDGQYEILTLCEDKILKNTLLVNGEGLIQTNVIIKQHFGQYDEDITLTAKVGNVSGIDIDDNVSKITFYIDGYKVGEGFVNKNQATTTINPKNLKLTSGIHNLEARYSGNTKFASSRSNTMILISQDQIGIDISAAQKIKYKDQNGYPITVRVSSNDIAITEGAIIFYIDEEEIGRSNLDEYGNATIVDTNIDYKPGTHILTAKYSGTNQYISTEKSLEIEIIGGETIVNVFNLNAKPSDTVTIKARITNVNNQIIKNGYATFTIDDTVMGENVPVENGYCSYSYNIPSDILDSESEKELIIKVNYIDDQDIYQPGEGIGKIVVRKHPIIIKSYNYFYAYQYEPIGLYLQLEDAVTNTPVTEGTITVTIPEQGIEISNCPIDPDGGVRIVHNPIDFSAKEFNKLLKFKFKTNELLSQKELPVETKDENDNLIYSYDDNNIENLYRIYSGSYDDLNLMDFILEDNHLFYNLARKGEEAQVEEVFIGADGYLYARTNIDSIRNYLTGACNLEITYNPGAGYEEQTKNAIINFKKGSVDIDLLHYDLQYNIKEDNINCYVTEYNLEDNEYNINMNDGIVSFYIDQQKIGEAVPLDGVAAIPVTALQDVKTGRHLLSTEYIPRDKNKENTQTFSILNLDPIQSYLNVSLNKIFDGETSQLTVILTADDNDIDLTGILNIYLDDEKINSINILNSENIIGNVAWDRIEDLYEDSDYNKKGYKFIFNIDIPNNLDDSNHTLIVEYSGNTYVMGTTDERILKPEQIDLTLNAKNITVAQGKKAVIKAIVDSPVQDFVNEGTVVLQQGSNNDITKGYVYNNIALLEFTAPTEIGEHAYTIKFLETDHYKEAISASNIIVNVIPLQDIIYISQEAEYDQQQEQSGRIIVQTLEEAQQCVKENGTIFICDYVSLYNNINIDENITITGANDCAIQKNSINLLQDNALPIYHFNDFEETLYKIKDLTFDHITTIDFQVINSQLYLLKNDQQIPIFLLDDGSFYAKTSGILTEQISNININIKKDINVTIDNVIFNTGDNLNKQDLIINNDGTLKITKSIINNNVYVKNRNNITINQSLIYGKLLGITNNTNVDNNWWGSNKSPYNTNNHIILTIDSNNDPAIIGEDITIQSHLIGVNGEYYDIPAPQFKYTSETGYFSIDAGYFVENTAYTTFIDGVKEEKVYCTVDNEKVGIQIYDYDHKTEIILDPATEIPIGYQIPFKAKVQSCADTFYKFDENNNIIKRSNAINDGYISFTLNGKSIGKAKVINGEAILPIYLSTQIYETDIPLNLQAHYKSESDYFDSYADKDITLINDADVCYVSKSGSNTNAGTFDAPIYSLQQAIMLNKNTIYIKDGIYEDNNINISGTQNIKKYNYDVIFKNNDEPIFVSNDEDSYLYIEGLTFEDNNAPIIDNVNQIICKKCIFYNNKSEYLIKDSKVATIEYSAIVNNNKIFNTYNNHLNYNWYGTNDISELEEYEYIDNYLYMTVDTSKDIIYLGSVAKIIARLQHYKVKEDPSLMYELEEDIPLRIALFDTDFGSLMPIKDYTYNNMATSFLNTNDLTNTNHIILDLPSNTNYINKPIILQCNVYDLFDNTVNDGVVIFELNSEKYNVNVSNGLAELQLLTSLFEGQYDLTCTYVGKNTVSKASQTFTVQKPEIKVKEISIDPYDHIYQTTLKASFVDSFDTKINKQAVNIYVNNILIKEDTILDGELNSILSYEELNIGRHTITITTDNYQEKYEPFSYTYIFYANQKETTILFDYETLPLSTEDDHVYSDLTFNVVDKDKKYVQTGYIEVFFDNQPIYIDDNGVFTTEEETTKIYLQNGLAIIYDFFTTIEGSHSIMIHYVDESGKYEETVYDTSIEVNTEEVVIASDILFSQLEVEIDKPLKFNFPIRNKDGKPVKRGTVKLTLIGHAELTEEPLPVQKQDGYIVYNEVLPTAIKPATYNLEIKYIDDTNKYKNTTEIFNFTVKPVTTQIIINQIEAKPNETKTINYEVTSYYGPVFEGVLTAYYDDIEIGKQFISDLSNTMDLNIPFLKEDLYKIKFTYHSIVGNYADSEIITDLIINQDNVQMDITPTQYYPEQDFDLIVSVKDKNNNENVDMGIVTLYIDNVKYDNANVVNGEAIFHRSFNQVKTYQLIATYEGNDFYQQTKIEKEFRTNYIPISCINIGIMPSLPNQTYETTVDIDAGSFEVTDGMLTFYINGEILNSYMVTEHDQQYVTLHIPNLSAGTYTLEIEYNGSSIFEDKKVEKSFTIETQDPTMTLIVPNSVSIDDNITIKTTNLPTNTNSVIEYYLSTIENTTDRFIKMVHTNNRNELEFNYKLPYLTEAQYYIVAKFVNDEYYNQKIVSQPITINKNSITMDITDQTIKYQDELIIDIDINDQYFNEEVYFSIKNEETYEDLGSTKAIDGVINFEKTLDLKYGVGNYKLRINSKNTTIYNSYEKEIDLNITPAIPQLKEVNIEEYIGNKIDTSEIIFIDKYNNVLDGIIDDIDYTVQEDATITIDFTPTNTNFAKVSPEINIIPLLNKVEWTLTTSETVTRTKEVECDFEISSLTSELPVSIEDVEFILSDGIQDVEVNMPTFIIPKSFIDTDYYNLKLSFEKENFESKEEIIKLQNKNEKSIEVADNVTLQDALHLISDYGTIQIKNDIDTTGECVNNKNVRIVGNNHTISNNIINDGSLIITDLTFENCTTTAIYNNSELHLDNCNFVNNGNCDTTTKGGAIYINNKNKSTIIQHCTFNGNKASLYGGAIFSEKGNDIIIQYNTFTQNGCENTSGSSISVNGKMYIANNNFYNNIGQSEIHILNGNINIENNYFDGSLTYNIDNHMGGNVQCNLNYFGYNDYESIKNKAPSNITIDNWLRSSYELEYTQPINSPVLAKITPRINKYQVKTEKELTDIETNFGEIPLDEDIKLNKSFTIEKNLLPYTLTIGQEQYIIGGNNGNTGD